MNKQKEKIKKRDRRRSKIRFKISGTKERPRLSVFKSNKGMYLQLIDDSAGKTIVSAHTKEIKTKGKKMEISVELGKLIAKKAIDKKIENIVFDRGGFKFHGRISSVAEGAKAGGLKF